MCHVTLRLNVPPPTRSPLPLWEPARGSSLPLCPLVPGVLAGPPSPPMTALQMSGEQAQASSEPLAQRPTLQPPPAGLVSIWGRLRRTRAHPANSPLHHPLHGCVQREQAEEGRAPLEHVRCTRHASLTLSFTPRGDPCFTVLLLHKVA